MPRKNKTEEETEKIEEGEKEDKSEEKAKEKERLEKIDKKKELEEKAKKLAEKIEIRDKKDIKQEVEKEKAKKKTKGELFPLDDYVRYSAHLGTKAVTPNMRQYVYRRRADGIAVLNTHDIDEKLKQAAEFLKDFSPEDIFMACKRESCWSAAEKFSEVTGIRVFTKKYPAGIITNIRLENFFETELVIICDPWLDKNALNDACKVKKPVIALCDTNNLTTGVTKIVPCNNKSGKSVGLILYLLAREYLRLRGKEKEAMALKIEDFAGVSEEEIREKEQEKRKRVEEGV